MDGGRREEERGSPELREEVAVEGPADEEQVEQLILVLGRPPATTVSTLCPSQQVRTHVASVLALTGLLHPWLHGSSSCSLAACSSSG